MLNGRSSSMQGSCFIAEVKGSWIPACSWMRRWSGSFVTRSTSTNSGSTSKLSRQCAKEATMRVPLENCLSPNVSAGLRRREVLFFRLHDPTQDCVMMPVKCWNICISNSLQKTEAEYQVPSGGTTHPFMFTIAISPIGFPRAALYILNGMEIKLKPDKSAIMKNNIRPGYNGVFLHLIVLTMLAAGCGQKSETVAVDGDDIGGVVMGSAGPEAGVWVIAETYDLPTRFARIVVTDDKGQYLIPDLPAAKYKVWVRGYGLVDSPKVDAEPGSNLDLSAVIAPNEQAAAEYYPAGYWFSLMHIPEKSKFPGTGAEGNGIPEGIKTQAQFLRIVKSGACLACHQLGSKGTRKFHESMDDFESSVDAWERRLQSGQAGGNMISTISQVGREEVLKMFADWTDRIAESETPEAPPRPQGEERNVVITQWDWADPKAYLHDLVSTDRRDPTVNANGSLYGALEASADYLPVLDPVNHSTSQVPLTVRDPNTEPADPHMPQPSPYWGDEPIWNSKANVHNPMLDDRGRVWITAAVRPPDNPDYCKEGSDHPSAKLFPKERAYRHLGFYDPKTKKYTHISTCFSTHHLMFAEDESNTLWTSGGGDVIGWLDTKKYEETGDEAASQGWTALILDTNGNGKRDSYVEPDQPVNPAMDKRIARGLYA